MARASRLTSDRPRPVPPKRLAMPSCACVNGRNSRLISVAVMPMPLSETANTRRSAGADLLEPHRETDLALLGEFHRVVDQVLQRRAQPHDVAGRLLRQTVGDVDLAGEFRRFGAGTQRRRRRVGKRGRVERPALQDQIVRTLARRIDDQRRQRGEMLGVVLEHFDPAPLTFAEFGRAEEFGGDENTGQRRADVVGEAGHHPLGDARFGLGFRGTRRTSHRPGAGSARASSHASDVIWLALRPCDSRPRPACTNAGIRANQSESDEAADIGRRCPFAAQRAQGRCAGRFGELLAVGSENQPVVAIDRRRISEQRLQHPVHAGRRRKVQPANHMR